MSKNRPICLISKPWFTSFAVLSCHTFITSDVLEETRKKKDFTTAGNSILYTYTLFLPLFVSSLSFFFCLFHCAYWVPGTCIGWSTFIITSFFYSFFFLATRETKTLYRSCCGCVCMSYYFCNYLIYIMQTTLFLPAIFSSTCVAIQRCIPTCGEWWTRLTGPSLLIDARRFAAAGYLMSHRETRCLQNPGGIMTSMVGPSHTIL